MMEKKAAVKERQDVIDKREEPIKDRIKAIHAEGIGANIAQMGSDLLYLGHFSNIVRAYPGPCSATRTRP